MFRALRALVTLAGAAGGPGQPPGGDFPAVADGGRVVVPVADRERLRSELARFAGGALASRADGSLSCEFGGVTHFTVLPDGRIDSGMPRHAFDGPADRLVFDHDRGEVTVETDLEEATLSYTFRRP